jgi:ABC-2 type transport system permease protein
MADVLRVASDALPLTYAYDALARVATDRGGARLALDVAIVVAATGLSLAFGAATLRRRTA